MSTHVVAIEDSVGIDVRFFDNKIDAINYSEILDGYYFEYKNKSEIILEDIERRKREAIVEAVDKYENKKSEHIRIDWKN